MNTHSDKYIEVPVLTVTEAARFIGVGKRVIYQLIDFEEIRAVREHGKLDNRLIGATIRTQDKTRTTEKAKQWIAAVSRTPTSDHSPFIARHGHWRQWRTVAGPPLQLHRRPWRDRKCPTWCHSSGCRQNQRISAMTHGWLAQARKSAFAALGSGIDPVGACLNHHRSQEEKRSFESRGQTVKKRGSFTYKD
jgi:excisionase family DNA binding protein